MRVALDLRLKAAVGALLALFVLVMGFAASEYQQKRSEFERDESPRLGEGETGLRRAYGSLRRHGYRVTVSNDARSRGLTDGAWWIFQPGAEWFSNPEQRAQEVRAFLSKGGTVVLAPDEAMTVVEADTLAELASGGSGSSGSVFGEDETPPARLDRFFSALLLDVHLMAFETDADFESVEEELAPSENPPSGAVADMQGYVLPVSGRGGLFEDVTELRTSWGTYWEGDSLLSGDIRLNSDGFPLVVELPVGAGRLVLVAESTYFENEFLDASDNGKLLDALARHFGGAAIRLSPGRESASD